MNHRRIKRSVSPAIMAGYRYRPHQDYRACGQHREVLQHIVKYAPGWDARKVRRLAKIWDTYHLADMRAGCVHTDAGELCPKKYTHGRAWFTQTVPASIIQELRDMFADCEER